MAFWRKNVRLEQKKIILENKNKRYNVLNENVFTPLSKSLITFTIPVDNKCKYNDDEFNKLSDLLSIKNNPHYPEAHNHLIQDMERFDDRFDEINREVNIYNDSLDNFRKNGLDKLIYEYLDKNNLKFTVNQPKSNELYRGVLDHLKKLWFNGDNFEFETISDGELRIDKDITAAIFSTDAEKERIETCINELKKCDKIIEKIEYFKNEPTKILEKGMTLSEITQNNIIKKINLDEYDTTCKDCEKLDDF